MTNSNQKERFQTKIAMLEQNNQVLRNKCEEYLGELVDTKKKLDIAVDALESAHDYYEHCVIRDKEGDEVNWDCTALNMELDISKALEQIKDNDKDVK